MPLFHHYKGFIIVYDVTNLKSFKNAKIYFEQIREHARHKNQNIFVIGNKSDLKYSRQVSTEEAMEYLNEKNVNFS